MFKLNFTLKQHTPLIHFQHDQEGATIRATELKPKLDRFLIKEFKLTEKNEENKESPKNEFKTFFINNGIQSLALDYKIRITPPQGAKEYFLPLATSLNSRTYPSRESQTVRKVSSIIGFPVKILCPSPFFSNSDKLKFKWESEELDENKSKLSELEFGITYNGLVKCEIICFQPKLLKLVGNCISKFFLLHNFGKRQSKGFGSFTIEKVNGSLITNKIENNLCELVVDKHIESAYVFKSNSNQNLRDLFSKIDETWKILKSGKNFKGYTKSDLFLYFYHQKTQIRWEKRAIKKELKRSKSAIFKGLKFDKSAYQNRILSETDTNDNHFFIRALLGLAEHNEFAMISNRNRTIIKIEDSELGSNSEETNNDVVSRFQSPITFKPIGEKIFLLTKEIPNELFLLRNGNARKFDFKLTGIFDNKVLNQKLLSLTVPEQFNVSNFLDSDKIDPKSGKTENKSVALSHGFIKIIENE